MKLIIEVERENDGRWIADAVELPGCMIYGKTKDEALEKIKGLALRVLTDQRGGWTIKRQKKSGGISRWILTLLKQKGRLKLAFDHGEEIGPKMLARISKRTGLADFHS